MPRFHYKNTAHKSFQNIVIKLVFILNIFFTNFVTLKVDVLVANFIVENISAG